MKKLAALLLCFLPSMALAQTMSELANECRPVKFFAFASANENQELATDAERRLSTALETRLRTARLYDPQAEPSVMVELTFLQTRLGNNVVGYAVSYTVDYVGWAVPTHDFEFSNLGNRRPALLTIWGRSGISVGPEDAQPGYAIELALEKVDEFVLEYLRANEAFCT